MALLSQQVSEVLSETTPELVHHQESILLRAYLKVLRVVEATRRPLVLQVACGLPDGVPRRKHAFIAIAINQTVVRQVLSREGLSDEMFLNFDFVHSAVAIRGERYESFLFLF